MNERSYILHTRYNYSEDQVRKEGVNVCRLWKSYCDVEKQVGHVLLVFGRKKKTIIEIFFFQASSVDSNENAFDDMKHLITVSKGISKYVTVINCMRNVGVNSKLEMKGDNYFLNLAQARDFLQN